MKNLRLGLFAAFVSLHLVTTTAHAIEGLKLKIVCPHVVLFWPSIEGENYIVQYRETLGTNTPWLTLTNYLPAESGTNTTTFTHSNRVDCPVGQVFGMMRMASGGSAMMKSASVSLTKAERAELIQAREVVRLAALFETCKEEGREPYEWEIKNQPPLPPTVEEIRAKILNAKLNKSDRVSAAKLESAEFASKEGAALKSFGDGSSANGPQPAGLGGGNVPGCGFYQVVRVGINLFGVTNGTVLSGKVPLHLEFGNPDTNRELAVVFLSDDSDEGTLTGSTFPNLPYEAANHLSGEWDTTQVTNGSYNLVVGARLSDGTVYLDYPVTVTVSNVIWFPDAWNVGGMGIYIGAQTIFTNGVWHLDVYDDQNSYLGYLNGPVDSDGYISYPGISGPGFTLDNTDGFGNQNPSTAYSIAVSAGPTNMPPPYTMATNKVFIEPAWNYATKAVVCHMNLFQGYQPGWTDVHTLMEAVWNIEEPFHQNLLGGITTPYEVFVLANWSNVVVNLLNPACRDFFYFGHGSETRLGPNTNVDLRVSDIKMFLQNSIDDPLTATNRHPFRFVFFDGCNTADGQWPQAFGIPKKEGMVITDFTQKRGIRPRAFMGWNRKKVIGTGIISGGSLHPQHETYITAFWQNWANGMTVKAAITAARNAAPNGGLGMKLYGAEDLQIYY